MDEILKISHLSAGYRKGKVVNTVLSDLSLTLNRGELVSLLGANGVGKSTLIRTITGLQLALAGDVMIDGKPVKSLSVKELSKLIAVVSTDKTFARGLTVEELVGLGRQPHTGFIGRLSKGDKEIVADSIKLVGMQYKSGSYIAELSDGERQKVMIARALAQGAPIIILDEPTAFLDVASRVEVLMLLRNLAVSENKAILLSSHDILQSLQLSDRLWLILSTGKVVSGVTEDIVLSGQLSNLFQDRKVNFDTSTGDYICNIATGDLISVTSDSPMLVKWLSNALRRNGFAIGECKNVVKIISSNNICFDGKTFSSVGDFLSYLKKK